MLLVRRPYINSLWHQHISGKCYACCQSCYCTIAFQFVTGDTMQTCTIATGGITYLGLQQPNVFWIIFSTIFTLTLCCYMSSQLDHDNNEGYSWPHWGVCGQPLPQMQKTGYGKYPVKIKTIAAETMWVAMITLMVPEQVVHCWVSAISHYL